MELEFNSQPWWQTNDYQLVIPVPAPLEDETLWGERGPAMVRLWAGGKTDRGWGLKDKEGQGPGFIQRYKRGDFLPRKILHGYHHGNHEFAWVMRSGRLVVIDIDGKNGGFDHVSKLGFLPPTLAETSKSGNGYHLFYSVQDEWSPDGGFGEYHDYIGIETGVDVRGTGCVYHYRTQRWNGAGVAPLPEHLVERLHKKHVARAVQASTIEKILENYDDEEILTMHDSLLAELARPIPEGRRNMTLYALGCQLMQAKVPDWENAILDRAAALDMEPEEGDKIVANIQAYGGK